MVGNGIGKRERLLLWDWDILISEKRNTEINISKWKSLNFIFHQLPPLRLFVCKNCLFCIFARNHTLIFLANFIFCSMCCLSCVSFVFTLSFSLFSICSGYLYFSSTTCISWHVCSVPLCTPPFLFSLFVHFLFQVKLFTERTQNH